MNKSHSEHETQCRFFRNDSEVMRYALSLAERGLGLVEPNPAVGAVIVDVDGTLIAEGFHEGFGKPHAEVNAILAAGDRCRGADLFVTLEPCSHHGKTPPCAPLVADAGFRRVIIGCQDPAPHVAGRGIQSLRDQGVNVVTGVEQEAARKLIAPFEMLHCHHRPWIHAKWAMTLDGKIATASGHSQWISNEGSRRIVHQIRGRMDAIITGAGTVRHDDPMLTARPPGPRTPVRIIVDADATCLSATSRLVRTAAEAPVLLIASTSADKSALRQLEQMGIQTLTFPSDRNKRLPLDLILAELANRKFTNVLVEAGPRLLGSFFDMQLIDEVTVFIAPKIIGGADAPSPIAGLGLDAIPSAPSLDQISWTHSTTDLILHAYPKKGVRTRLNES
ncbi:MAG: bifunctional diaminohydroxyphosphoribosylaminopyrimidine deaminase/5-amino-6-(5-phosphoribosylamino)uracil reductase RibD [Planctomyces sp.]|nr:bifunctional diaminohydroxyphosphoribosylaminopyrimidine deaminase/5-amino-6-(5-phosphoribosylamino)uracil reductase RibD [Planctomyces sp.]